MALQIRRGTDAERQTITPKMGEPIYTTDQKELYIGDGTTQGGILISGVLVNDENPRLGTDLDLNGNDIIGTGNINIDGTITATGNINLGDGAEDNLIVGGQIGSSLIPNADVTFDLGAESTRWNNVYATAIDASTIRGTFDGDINGSVYSDDSTTVLVDATNNVLTGNFTGNVRNNANTEDVLNTTDKALNVRSITFDTTGAEGAIIQSPGDITIFSKTNFLSFTAPDPTNPFLKLTGYYDGVDAEAIVGARARGTFLAPGALQDGDEIINLGMAPYTGASFPDGGAFKGVTNLDGSDYSTKWVAETLNTSGSLVVGLEIENGGVKTNTISSYDSGKVEFTSVPKLPSFASDAARDAAITAPESGMIILNVNKFQGYINGTGWVDLN